MKSAIREVWGLPLAALAPGAAAAGLVAGVGLLGLACKFCVWSWGLVF